MLRDIHITAAYEARKRHNQLQGTTSTGYEVARRYIDLGRQMGKTCQMADSLTSDSIVFCINATTKKSIEEYIRAYGLNARVEVAISLNHVREKLRGREYPLSKVFIDNSIFDAELMRMIDDFYQKD